MVGFGVLRRRMASVRAVTPCLVVRTFLTVRLRFRVALETFLDAQREGGFTPKHVDGQVAQAIIREDHTPGEWVAQCIAQTVETGIPPAPPVC